MYPQWARDIRDQCRAAGVPYFFKQHGEWLGFSRDKTLRQYIGADGERLGIHEFVDKPHEIHGDYGIARVGKERAGRLLDGKLWEEMPEIQPRR